MVLTLFNIHLAEKTEKEIRLELNFEEPPEENEEIAVPEENKPETHMAYNETVTSRFDKEVREFKTLEEIKEGKKSEDSEENRDQETTDEGEPDPENNYLRTANGTSVLPASGTKEKQSEQSDGDNSSDAIAKTNSVNTNSSISYSLVGRIHKKLPNPIYTCMARGKIVINIKVNTLGHVTEATFNKRSSTSRNGCLVDHAITYALRSTFNRKEGESEQIGTITYLFQGE